MNIIELWEKLGGIWVESEDMPDDEIWIVDYKRMVVAKIINIGE